VLVEFPKVDADWLITGNTNIQNDTPITPVKNTIKEKQPSPTLSNNEKQIKKIVVFYTDNTFEEIIKG